MFAEVVVAAGERHVGRSAGGGQRPSRTLRPVETDGLVAGRFLAAETGEELVEVVDDRHAGTAVQAASPVSTHAAT